MNDSKNTSAEIKLHPGQAGSDDDSRFKRTKVLEVNLSPYEFDEFKKEWRTSDFNSMAKMARYKFFGGTEHSIDLYFEQKRDDRILAAKYLAELNKQGKNLNQIAKQLSSKSDFTRQETQLLVVELKNTLLAIQEIKDKFSPQKKI